MRWLIVALLFSGCAFKLGPGDGWLAWDVCGFSGGVDASVSVMGNTLRVGCFEQGDEPEPEVELLTPE